MRILLTCVFIAISFKIVGQPPLANFTISPSVCLQEKVNITNSSTNASEYFWDFCADDLSKFPTGNVLVNNFGGFGTRVEVKESDGQLYGFIFSGGTRNLYRLDFGSDIKSNPTLNDLGDVGLNSNQLRAIDIVQENGLYFGFIVDSQKDKLYRVNFGNSLANAPQDAVEIFSGAPLNIPYQVSTVSEGSLKYLFVTNQGDGNLVRMKFDDSYANTVSESFQLSVTSNFINGISFIKSEGNWFCLTASPLLSEVQKLNFVNGINDNSPVITSITIPSNPIGIEVVNENGNYHGFAQTRNPTKSIYRIDFGNSMDNIPLSITDINNIGYGAAEIWNISIYNSGSDWIGFATEATGQNIFKLIFPNICFSNTEFSNEIKPEISAINPGTYNVALSAYDLFGGVSIQSKSLTVLGAQSPDISFTSQYACANNDVNFTSQNTSGNITDYNWDFGDTNTSMLQDPTHQYIAAADYPVTLQVMASNGCNNLARDTITIYNEPIPSFNLPSASPICSNQEYLFTNTSTFDIGSNPTWSWEVNGVPLSANQNLLYTISSTVMQDIKLIAAIPGCENEIANTINTVEEGPVADFTFMNGCEDSIINFTNLTTGTVTSYLWDFDEGNTSMQVDASNTFEDYGQYNVNLQASNVAGCVNNIVKQITIYSKPQTDFSIDLPPFSCSGSPSQFNDLTPNPPDSNLDTWTWSFGDPLNGISTTRNPQYIYLASGDYNVNLDVATNFGCTTSIQKQVTISESPIADFSFNPACVNQATTFTPTSSSGISSWQWKIGTATYNQQIPIHVFGSSSTFNAELTATSNNGCVSILSKQIIVPIPSTPDFSSANNCALQSTVFTDITASPSDPVVSRAWQFGTLGNGTGLTSSFTFPSSGSYPTKLTIINTSGCTYIISKNVSINNSPVPTFTATPTVGTPPLTVQVVNTTANAISQLWTVNNPENSTSSEVATNFTLSELGQYVVDLTVSNMAGCSAATSKIISVIVPSLDIELTSLSTNPSLSGEINLLISVKNKSNSPITNPKAFIDISGEVLISEILNTVIQPGQSYSQVLTTGIVESKGGIGYICVELKLDGDFDLTNNKLCLNQESRAVVLDPYPNPGADQMTIEWISADQSKVDIFIFDPIGRKVYDNSVGDFESGLNRITIPLQTLNPGMYYILFVSEGVRKSFQYVVRR